MAKKKKKPESGRPENWREICMERVPPWVEKAEEPPELKKAEKSSEVAED